MSTLHTPVNFDPANYTVIDDVVDNRPYVEPGMTPEDLAVALNEFEADMHALFGHHWRETAYRCAHCGTTNVHYMVAVEHRQTGERVAFGWICAERLQFPDLNAFKLAQLKNRAKARRERLRIVTLRNQFVAKHPEVADWQVAATQPEHAHNGFLHDVLGKLDQYGSLSDRQLAAVPASLQRDREYAARRAAEETEVKGPAPEGRVEVTGTVLSLKVQESDFGSTLKMLLKLDNNSRAWLTVPHLRNLPGGIDDRGGEVFVGRGDALTLRATFTPSHDDASFAFGTRPHATAWVPAKAEVDTTE
jgi:hypothetical protein